MHAAAIRIRAALLGLALLPSVTAQATLIVDASGGGDYTDIQSAVDAASPGDLIRVRHGVYPGPVLITKGLRVIGDRANLAEYLERANLNDGFVVRNIPSGQSFVASDLSFGPRGSDPYVIENCEGPVHLSRLLGRIRITNCAHVTSNEAFAWNIWLGQARNPVLVVSDSVAVFSKGLFWSHDEVEPAANLTRSMVTFVNCRAVAVQQSWGINPYYPPPTVEIIEGKFITDRSSTYEVGVSLYGLRGSRFHPMHVAPVEFFDGPSVIAEQEENTLDITLLTPGTSTVTAILASPPKEPIEIPNGMLYLDLSNSFFLFLGVPPAEGPALSLPIPQIVEKHGVPVTIQAAELIDGEVRLSLPTTIVL